MAGKDHVIDIIIKTNDQTGGGLKSAQSALLKFDAAVQRTNDRLNALTGRAHRITLSLIDRVSEPGSRINGMLRRLEGRAYRITLGLQNRATAGIRETEAQLFRLTARAYTVSLNIRNAVGGKVKGVADNIIGSTLGVGSDMLVGAGIGYGVYDTIKTYKDFQAQMSTVGAISGATGEDLEILTAKAKEMGAQTVFSATEAGKAFEYMAMAGWKTKDMTDGIEGIMNLAAASGEDLGRVSDIVTDALTAFGLQASDSAHFADVLAQASSNSNTNVGMMGDTFKYVAPLAGALKYSIEDIALAVGLMANAGIKGEQAGTSLRATITRLVDPPKDAALALDTLGITVKNADGTMKPFRQTMMELRTAFSGLSDSEKAQYASNIAGQEAMSGFLALINGSDSDVQKLADAIDHADGAAKRMSETRMNNLAGDIEQLGGAWETFKLSLMDGSPSNFLRGFVQGATEDIEKLNGYMKDGLDIGDIGRVAMDVIDQLKNKFLELDGVGSILAGGSLAGGLAKITKLSMKAFDAIRGVGGNSKAGGAGTSASSIDSMIVNARNVVLNGGAGAAMGAAIPTSGKGTSKSIPKGRGGRFLKGFGGIGTALMLGSSAYSLYDTYDQNQKAIAAASPENAEAVQYAGNQSMNASVGSTAGTVVGTLAGGALGSLLGPAGTAVGSMVGGAVGGMAGEAIGSNWEGIKESAGETFEWLKNSADEAIQGIEESFEGIGDWIGENLGEPLYNGFITALNFLVGGGDIVLGMLGELFSPAADWFTETVWTPVSESASEAWNGISEAAESAWSSISGAAGNAWETITGTVSSAWEAISGIFSPAADWFESTVWSPIASGVDGVYNSITSAFQSAYDTILGVFGGLVSWFESNVIGPIKEKFNQLASFGSRIVSRGESITGLVPKANGGFVNSPTEALIGEAGPEVVIPLSPSRRNRAYDLMQEAWDAIGGAPVSGDELDGGTSAGVSPIPIPVVQKTGSAAKVEVGGISISINVDAGGAGTPEDVVKVIKANINDITDDVAARLATVLGSIYSNQASSDVG